MGWRQLPAHWAKGSVTQSAWQLGKKMAAARYNQPGFEIVNHYTYVLAGDGDFMEGVSAEASSFAGHLGLGKLIMVYDSNEITIEGSTSLTFTESVKERYMAYGWQVLEVDGHNIPPICSKNWPRRGKTLLNQR